MPLENKEIGSEQDTGPVSHAEQQGVSLRAVLIGLALVPLNCYWVIASELRWYVMLTVNPLFVTPIFYLFFLVCVNAGIRRFIPRYVFKPAELIVIYIILVMSCTIATHDFLINLMSTIGWAKWFATPENRWETTFFPYLPKWLLITNKEVLKGYFNGNRSLYDPQVMAVWLKPLACWSVFVFAVGWMMMCMSVMLRRAWTDETRLSFPIVRLPLALTEEFAPGSVLRSSAFWMGFAVAAGFGIINGLHEWIPNIPFFQTRARPILFATPPGNTTWPFFHSYYPFAIGLAYLVPLDVSFSCWFFYLFMKAQSVLGYQLGLGSIPDFPFVMEQGIGAWTAFGVALLYVNRHYLAGVVRLALQPQSKADANEPMSYRVAFFGLIAGMLVFYVFWRAAGMSPGWVIVVLALYLLLAICITRVRAEAGGQHTVWDLEPKNLFRLFDSNTIGPSNLTAAAVSHWYWRLNRSHIMPSQFEAFKLAQEHKIKLRSLVLPMMAAIALATVCGLWACLHVFYSEGALAKCSGFAVWTGSETYNWLGSSISSGFKSEPIRWFVVGGSAIFVVMLSYMRARFIWFPFHPLGYCIGPGLMWLWCPFLIAWVVKLFVLRYGGLRLYRKTLPFFLGMVLGDYMIGAIWSLIGVVFHIQGYQIFH